VAVVPVVAEFAGRLAGLGWISDVFVAGSLATGDYVPRVSDLDLVALVDGPVDQRRQGALAAVHHGIDQGAGAGLNLGCVHVDAAALAKVGGSIRRGPTACSSGAFWPVSPGPNSCGTATPWSVVRRVRCCRRSVTTTCVTRPAPT
jgi:hypothetical protein